MRIYWIRRRAKSLISSFLSIYSIKSKSFSYCFSVSPANLNVFWQPKKKLDWNFVSKYCPYSAPGVGCGIPSKGRDAKRKMRNFHFKFDYVLLSLLAGIIS